jgi:NAD(P)-dependent dehydrogenase (short-subunit alcohol dehydrogenase family)
MELGGVADEIRSEGGDAVALAADLTGADWLSDLDGVAPEVDLLVNNAASFAPYGPLEEVSAEAMHAVLEVGVLGALRLTQHVMGGMKERGFGRIVSVGSVAATHGAGGQVAYATAKAALAGMTRTLAIEGGRNGVTANLLELGLVETERVETEIDPVIRERLVRNTAIGRAGTPEEVARVIAFLCSEESAYITGAVIPVSGGLGLGLYPEQLSEGGRPSS